MAFADTPSMAVFCDFENVAIGVRDANYEKFDIKPVLERLLLKGGIVVKKAYCDWDRYKAFKATMHEANFELIEIPHVRQSGKNSADIRMVVDALDLCYTKAHVDTFVIISGDSDFSPLVSKLRENAKRVIGVGVKQSCSDLLIANCDEFIFYDDLVRDTQRANAKREAREAPGNGRRPSEEDKKRKEEQDARKTKAIDLAVATFDALIAERGDSGKIWASQLKDAIKRRKPDFNESYYGFRAFGNLLEEAQVRGFFEIGRDEKSGNWVSRAQRPEVPPEAAPMKLEAPVAEVAEAAPAADSASAATSVAGAPVAVEAGASARTPGRGRGRGRKGQRGEPDAEAGAAEVSPVAERGPETIPEAVMEASPASLATDAAPFAAEAPAESLVPGTPAVEHVSEPAVQAPASPVALPHEAPAAVRSDIPGAGAEEGATALVSTTERPVEAAGKARKSVGRKGKGASKSSGQDDAQGSGKGARQRKSGKTAGEAPPAGEGAPAEIAQTAAAAGSGETVLVAPPVAEAGSAGDEPAAAKKKSASRPRRPRATAKKDAG